MCCISWYVTSSYFLSFYIAVLKCIINNIFAMIIMPRMALCKKMKKEAICCTVQIILPTKTLKKLLGTSYMFIFHHCPKLIVLWRTNQDKNLRMNWQCANYCFANISFFYILLWLFIAPRNTFYQESVMHVKN